MIHICLEKVEGNDLWRKPNDHLNSVGNLILHLCGNVTQYIISGLGGLPDYRNRDAEFQESGHVDKKELEMKLVAVVDRAKAHIMQVSMEKYLREREIQGFKLTGLGAVLHAVEHFSYHTGQIALLVKLKTNQDLGFYDHVDLNIKNK